MKKGYVVTGQGTDRRRIDVGTSLVVGRSTHCGLVVADSAASRQHLEIRLTDGAFICRDLGSSNGTKVNGESIAACELANGDRIHIGKTILRFETGEDRARSAPEKTVFMQTVLDPTGVERESPPSSRSKELLEAAYTLMNAIASNFNTCDLVDSILHTTMDAINAQRGAILFAGPEEELQPCEVCGAVHTIVNGSPKPAGVDEILISESVARRVLRDGENVLYQTVRTDASMPTTVSISALNLSSILCVPIRTLNSILGILYIDTDIADHSYTHDDMLLAAAAGNSAGLALENARIHGALLEKQRIEQDIAAAWTIQEGFLIRDWQQDDPRFEVYGETQPAKVVGGDFYDFVRLDGDTVGVLIGDVSGKGVPAALTMAQLLAEFRLGTRDGLSPSHILQRISDDLVTRSQRGTFCTMSYVTIDLNTGRLRGANAGHHPTLVVSRDQTESVLGASGPPTGILPGIVWEDEEATISAGDTLLMYTDGIVEARSGGTQTIKDGFPIEYELTKLERLARQHAGDTPSDLIDAVNAEVRRFCAPLSPHDDCTMIALRYRGPE